MLGRGKAEVRENLKPEGWMGKSLPADLRRLARMGRFRVSRFTERGIRVAGQGWREGRLVGWC